MIANPIKNLLLLIGALLLCIVAETEATKTRLIDEDGIESIAQSVCSRLKGSYTQIGSVMTIRQLMAFFDNFPTNHKLKACRDTNLDAVHLLYDVVSTRNDNVCSDEKISLIEKFHSRYISKTKTDKQQQKLDSVQEVPRLLKNFFYHYATQVATVCKSSLVESLKEAERAGGQELSDPENIETVDKFLEKFAVMVGATSGKFKTYSEISLLWNYIDKLPIKEDNQYIRREGKRIAFLTADADNMKAFQRECSTRLKPVYGVSALPVIRLIDLGYYQNDEQFATDLAGRADLKRMIGVAQVCEFMLPLRVIGSDDPNLKGINLLTMEYANEIPMDEDEAKFDSIVIPDDHRSSMEGLNVLATATPDEAYQFVKTVRANVKDREKVLRNILENITHNMASKVKSLIGKIFCMKKEDGKVVRIDLTAEDEKPVEKSSALRDMKHRGKVALDSITNRFSILFHRALLGGGWLMVILVLPFIALIWIFDILDAMFRGILFALNRVFTLPKRDDKHELINKLIN